MLARISDGDALRNIITAVYIMIEMRDLLWKRNVGAELQHRWFRSEGLEMAGDGGVGRVKRAGTKERVSNKREDDELEKQTLRDSGRLGQRRRAR